MNITHITIHRLFSFCFTNLIIFTYCQGLALSVPEIVPFRLTKNLIDAMGVLGVEGKYNIYIYIMNIIRDCLFIFLLTK